MFTGIVEEVGSVDVLTRDRANARLTIKCDSILAAASHGASISVSGCCLTVVDSDDTSFSCDLMIETLNRTTLAQVTEGDRVNLEAAMRADGRFGGHIVQGHVDGVGVVTDRKLDSGTVFLSVRVPDGLGRYLVAQGSICLAGCSLTIVDVQDATLTVALIPETLASTTLGDAAAGDHVNVEVDVIAKYVERMVTYPSATQPDAYGRRANSADQRDSTGTQRGQ